MSETTEPVGTADVEMKEEEENQLKEQDVAPGEAQEAETKDKSVGEKEAQAQQPPAKEQTSTVDGITILIPIEESVFLICFYAKC